MNHDILTWNGMEGRNHFFNVALREAHFLQSYKLPMLWNIRTNSILMGSNDVISSGAFNTGRSYQRCIKAFDDNYKNTNPQNNL